MPVTIEGSGSITGLSQIDGRNLIHNGAMQVAQRGTSVASITTGGYYTADRWFAAVTTLGTWTQSVENDAPTGSGFRKSLKMLCTTADATPAAGDVVSVQHILEGQDLQRIAKGTASAKSLTISFWVKANATGTYIANMYDNDNGRAVSASYTINSSATWEYKTITFPADTTGAFDNDNAASLYLLFYLASGSNRTSGTLNTTWNTFAAANDAVGQTNLAATQNNYWQVTGIQLETGSIATPYEFRTYADDLRTCQRYYYRHVSGATQVFGFGTYYNTATVLGYVSFPVTMRATPVSACSSGTNHFQIAANGVVDQFNSLTLDAASPSACQVYNNTEISGTAGTSGPLSTASASSVVAFTADL